MFHDDNYIVIHVRNKNINIFISHFFFFKYDISVQINGFISSSKMFTSHFYLLNKNTKLVVYS